jgi:pilus assembly protein Flp/PilA
MQTLRRKGRGFLLNRSGQDLIEYALVVALIAFGAAAAMKTIASQINVAFTNVGAKLSTNTS